MQTHQHIDIVLLWVNGQEPDWQAQYQHYRNIEPDARSEELSGMQRYRDFNTLRYVLRSIERNMPWYNKLYLVTAEQTPDWLNRHHPKLICINHKDFFSDTSNLPTFNCNAIHVNLPNIKDLSEQFIVFDDDLILTTPMQPEDFFQNNLPVLPNYWGCFTDQSAFQNACRINLACAQPHKATLFPLPYWQAACKQLSIKLWLYNAAVSLYRLPRHNSHLFPASFDHLPMPLNKSLTRQILKNNTKKTQQTANARFRRIEDIYLWGILLTYRLQGKFIPTTRYSRQIFLQDHMRTPAHFCTYDRTPYESWAAYHATRWLKKGGATALCIQDQTSDALSSQAHAQITQALSQYLNILLPTPSDYEQKNNMIS